MRRAIALVALLTAAPAAGQVAYPPLPAATVDTSGFATKAEVQAAKASADSAVKSVNSATPNASGAVTIAVPQPANTTPPGVSDSSVLGTMTTMYALANHTHASKARKCRVTSNADGTFAWNFATGSGTGCPASTAFTTGVVPICAAVAEVAAGVTDVVNVQIVGTPTATGVNLLVNRANRSVASLLGLTVLSIPAQPGATLIHAICLEP